MAKLFSLVYRQNKELQAIIISDFLSPRHSDTQLGRHHVWANPLTTCLNTQGVHAWLNVAVFFNAKGESESTVKQRLKQKKKKEKQKSPCHTRIV